MTVRLTGVGLTHANGRRALQEVDLSVGRGERLAIIGPSGAGKTTLLRLLATSLQPSEGRLELLGAEPWRLSGGALRRLRTRLGLIHQSPPLPPRQRVVTAVGAGRLGQWPLWKGLLNLLHPLDAAGARDALARLDLADKLFERVDRLSGGERQRVGLARALVALAPIPAQTAEGARLLLVDEPLSALDPTRARQAIETLRDAAHSHGATLVATLHQVDVALAHFPRIVGLRDGALAFDLPAAEVTRERLAALYAQHEHELRGEVPPPALADEGPQPVVMHCR